MIWEVDKYTKIAVISNIVLSIIFSSSLFIAGYTIENTALMWVGILMVIFVIYYLYISIEVFYGKRNNTWFYIFLSMVFSCVIGGLILIAAKINKELFIKSREIKKEFESIFANQKSK